MLESTAQNILKVGGVFVFAVYLLFVTQFMQFIKNWNENFTKAWKIFV